jgi:hypothetical protein
MTFAAKAVVGASQINAFSRFWKNSEEPTRSAMGEIQQRIVLAQPEQRGPSATTRSAMGEIRQLIVPAPPKQRGSSWVID